jgi:hypothetical protein
MRDTSRAPRVTTALWAPAETMALRWHMRLAPLTAACYGTWTADRTGVAVLVCRRGM